MFRSSSLCLSCGLPSAGLLGWEVDGASSQDFQEEVNTQPHALASVCLPSSVLSRLSQASVCPPHLRVRLLQHALMSGHYLCSRPATKLCWHRCSQDPTRPWWEKGSLLVPSVSLGGPLSTAWIQYCTQSHTPTQPFPQTSPVSAPAGCVFLKRSGAEL